MASPSSSTSQHHLDPAQLREIYDFALDLGRRVGQILLQGVERRRGTDEGGRAQGQVEKESAVDIVTQVDLDVEAFVKGEIGGRYPGHHFIGEESYSAGSTRDYLVTPAPTWILDPLDGTVNYTHLFPLFCVSIAFCVGSTPVIGVIHCPMLDVTYSALVGYGAWLNDSSSVKPSLGTAAGGPKQRQRLPLVRNPVPPLPREAPKGCIFSCEWGKDRRDREDGNLYRKVESFVNMAAEIGGRGGKGGMVHGVRSLGSATMDLAYVATGAFDIWWEGGCWEWDVAAGICILREAGGLITTANPPPNIETDPVPEVRLGSRLYLAIRPAGDTPTETGRQAQERVVRETWKRVRELDYSRPGA